MITVFNIHNDFKRSAIEISSDASYKLLWEYLVPYQKKKLPESVTFKVAAGKKGYDLIRLFQSGEYFFSQRFVDVLSQFIDMSNKCYPIKIEGAEKQYYVIYNLDEYPYLNKDKAIFDEEPDFYCGNKITTPFFGISTTHCFVVTDEIKDAIIKSKLSNIYFSESFICTVEEYKEWQKSHTN